MFATTCQGEGQVTTAAPFGAQYTDAEPSSGTLMMAAGFPVKALSFQSPPRYASNTHTSRNVVHKQAQGATAPMADIASSGTRDGEGGGAYVPPHARMHQGVVRTGAMFPMHSAPSGRPPLPPGLDVPTQPSSMPPIAPPMPPPGGSANAYGDVDVSSRGVGSSRGGVVGVTATDTSIDGGGDGGEDGSDGCGAGGPSWSTVSNGVNSSGSAPACTPAVTHPNSLAHASARGGDGAGTKTNRMNGGLLCRRAVTSHHVGCAIVRSCCRIIVVSRHSHGGNACTGGEHAWWDQRCAACEEWQW